jgi:hypothetical protein
MNTTFDIVMRDEDFVLYSDGKPLLTPYENEVAHSNSRLLRQAITSELLQGKECISSLSLIIKLTDINAGAIQAFSFDLNDLIENDPLLKKGENSSATLSALMMQDDFPFADFVFLNSSSIASAMGAFQYRKEENQSIREFTTDYISGLTVEQKLALNTLSENNGCGIMVHLLFLSGYLSMSEYATAVIILKLRGNSKDITDVLDISGISGLSGIQNRVTITAQTVVDFLTLCKSENKISVIEEIIKRGEDNQTEFKSTLRWDLRQGIKNAAIEHASLKTMCAFLNSEGGELLIGVRDDGSIEGIETDKFENDDRFLLHIWTLIKTCMGQEVVEWVKTSLQKFGDKTVCRVSCKRAAKPIFLNQKGFEEAFFIRVGPSSSNLEISSALKYIQQHF